jgi:ubiquinone/menaquinone biosynthesis C-methylase UbiE
MHERDRESRAIEDTLRRPDVHAKWEQDFRTSENAKFYDAALEYVGNQLDATVRPKLLDAGCGICDYAIRLARQGFLVTAVDFSEGVLANARANLERHGSPTGLTLGRENLLGLSFRDEAFDAVLCWGVLMHIPDILTATSERARVVRPGGRLAVSETNFRSIESTTLRALRRLTGRGLARITRTEAGLEHWSRGAAGDLLTRECDILWLINRFGDLGLHLRVRVAGQFSESYVRIRSRTVRRLIHGLNQQWFDRVKWASPALGNILVFERPQSG